MKRPIATLNQRILFQKNSVVVDEYANHKNEWVDYFECAAYVNTWVKQEHSDGVTTEYPASMTFETRYCSELAAVTTTDYRIIFDGHAYNIQTIDLLNYQKRMMYFKGERYPRA